MSRHLAGSRLCSTRPGMARCRANDSEKLVKVSDRELQRQMDHASFQTTRSYAKHAEVHRQSLYDVHLRTLAKAKSLGPKVASEKHDGGQEADNARLESATA